MQDTPSGISLQIATFFAQSIVETSLESLEAIKAALWPHFLLFRVVFGCGHANVAADQKSRLVRLDSKLKPQL